MTDNRREDVRAKLGYAVEMVLVGYDQHLRRFKVLRDGVYVPESGLFRSESEALAWIEAQS